tara:strand:+ start:1410 stop:2243 length:834 start_codon:yes stop_codon:yes gene_type:complete
MTSTINTNNVSFSHIYNILTSSTHNGSDSIKLGDFAGQLWNNNPPSTVPVQGNETSINTHFRSGEIGGSGITPGTYQIGSGTSNSSKSPFYGLYDYSQYGIIYLASEIHSAAGTSSGTSGTISSLFFQYDGWTGGYTVNNQTVKISHVGSAIQIERGPTGSGSSSVDIDYSNVLTLTNTTTVKSNFTFTKGSEDWEEIGDNVTGQSTGFDTDFLWNGTNNILISWENRDGTWTSGYGHLEGTSATRRAHSWYKDNSYPTTSSGNNINIRANIKLVFS